MSQKNSMIDLTSIKSISPSLMEHLRHCFLKAALSKLASIDLFVLGNPKGWLGTAYHEVLEAAGTTAGGGVRGLEVVWDQAIQRLHKHAQEHPLNRRFGKPEKWPSYYLIRAMSFMRARKLIKGAFLAIGDKNQTANNIDNIGVSCREEWLRAAGGRLVGRPDVVYYDTIIDFKSGDIYEHGKNIIVKGQYIRQLQFYAYLIKECTGKWPTRGVLFPMNGAPVEIHLSPDDCETTALEALKMLDTFNRRISTEKSANELGSPSPDSCKWCQYQLLCPAFWAEANETWNAYGVYASLGGLVTVNPKQVHSGNAIMLLVDVNEGTESRQIVDLSPLSPIISPSINLIKVGTHIRVVGLYRRLDGTLSPGLRTVIARHSDLPIFGLGSS